MMKPIAATTLLVILTATLHTHIWCQEGPDSTNQSEGCEVGLIITRDCVLSAVGDIKNHAGSSVSDGMPRSWGTGSL